MGSQAVYELLLEYSYFQEGIRSGSFSVLYCTYIHKRMGSQAVYELFLEYSYFQEGIRSGSFSVLYIHKQMGNQQPGGV